MKWFSRGLVFKARGLVYHSTLGSRVNEEEEGKVTCAVCSCPGEISGHQPPTLTIRPTRPISDLRGTLTDPKRADWQGEFEI